MRISVLTRRCHHAAQAGNICDRAPVIISTAMAARMMPMRRFDTLSAIGDIHAEITGAVAIIALKKDQIADKSSVVAKKRAWRGRRLSEHDDRRHCSRAKRNRDR